MPLEVLNFIMFQFQQVKTPAKLTNFWVQSFVRLICYPWSICKLKLASCHEGKKNPSMEMVNTGG